MQWKLSFQPLWLIKYLILIKSISITHIFPNKTKIHVWLIKKKASTGPRQGYGSRGVNSILDVLENDTKVNFKESLNGKSTISKRERDHSPPVPSFVGSLAVKIKNAVPFSCFDFQFSIILVSCFEIPHIPKSSTSSHSAAQGIQYI